MVNNKQVIKDYRKLLSKGRKRFISELARKHHCSRAYIYKVIQSTDDKMDKPTSILVGKNLAADVYAGIVEPLTDQEILDITEAFKEQLNELSG
jgi:hypothetical protein